MGKELIEATGKGDWMKVKRLLDDGANPKAADNSSNRVLDHANEG